MLPYTVCAGCRFAGFHRDLTGVVFVLEWRFIWACFLWKYVSVLFSIG
jgi:hypothetical protein